jgi:magnesium-protoporphyrin O-methyltransferase
VVCCYPDYEALVAKSAALARKYYALVFPKDWWVLRQGLRLVNWFSRAQKSLYVAYVHPVAGVERLIRANGFVPVYQRSTLLWHVWVWERKS